MSKTVYISVLEKEEDKGRQTFQTVTRYGLSAAGHFWSDNLAEMEWAAPIQEMDTPDVGVWVVIGSVASFEAESVRIGLSLLALALQARKGLKFPIILCPDDGDLDKASLPTPLADADVVTSAAALGPKLAAKANIPVKPVDMEYHIDLHPIPKLGLWYAVGPGAGHAWKGAMLGVDAGEINAHGVGPRGQVPERCVLNYAMQGMKLTLGGTEFTAWAVQNELDHKTSYYCRVHENPKTLVFGEFPDSEDAELFTIRLA
ncbi:MAG: hypothetical protein ACOCVM_04875 [Desulfovibrionaceae bacterium]